MRGASLLKTGEEIIKGEGTGTGEGTFIGEVIELGTGKGTGRTSTGVG